MLRLAIDNVWETWNKGETPTHKLLYSVSMGDKDHGWAVGQVGTILRTEDGGKTWVEQANLKRDEASHLFGVQAIDANRAIAVGTWGSRIYTDDGGKSWEDNSLTVGVEHPQFVWLDIEDQETVRSGGKVYEDISLQDVWSSTATAPAIRSGVCRLAAGCGRPNAAPKTVASWASGRISVNARRRKSSA